MPPPLPENIAENYLWYAIRKAVLNDIFSIYDGRKTQ